MFERDLGHWQASPAAPSYGEATSHIDLPLSSRSPAFSLDSTYR